MHCYAKTFLLSTYPFFFSLLPPTRNYRGRYKAFPKQSYVMTCFYSPTATIIATVFLNLHLTFIFTSNKQAKSLFFYDYAHRNLTIFHINYSSINCTKCTSFPVLLLVLSLFSPCHQQQQFAHFSILFATLFFVLVLGVFSHQC